VRGELPVNPSVQDKKTKKKSWLHQTICSDFVQRCQDKKKYFGDLKIVAVHREHRLKAVNIRGVDTGLESCLKIYKDLKISENS
jgi:hypothetical protein